MCVSVGLCLSADVCSAAWKENSNAVRSNAPLEADECFSVGVCVCLCMCVCVAGIV